MSDSHTDADADWPRTTEQQKLAKENLMGLMDRVDEVKDKMHDNIERVLERGDKLEELQNRSQSLEHSAANLSDRVKNHHK